MEPKWIKQYIAKKIRQRKIMTTTDKDEVEGSFN